MRHALVERVLSRAQRVSARCITVSIGTIVAAGLAAFGLTGAVGAQTLAALPTFTSKLAERGKAHPTPASIDFCRRMPTECKIDPAEPAVIALTPDVWQTLVAVNRAVNNRIKPITDLKHWGVIDRWDFPDDGLGDCEDYQLLKRKLLADRGLPRRAMRMTVVRDSRGEGHAVLMIRTDRGDFILDNQRAAILPWKSTRYVFVKREGQTSQAWVSLETDVSPVVTALSEEE
jgi:predicted transglutaminase-like cysteine proteinase